MISEIKSIKNYGIFKNFSPGTNHEITFLKFNLFYGWNGSGKSTLSKVFGTFSGEKNSDYPSGDYKIEFNGQSYTSANIKDASITIDVFNQEFIKKNLNFDTHKANSILYISEEKIDEKERLIKKKEELKLIEGELDKKTKSINKLTIEISGEYSKIAKNIKSSFGLIQTHNKNFLNYDKTKLENFIFKNKDKINDDKILSLEDLSKVKLSALATERDKVFPVPLGISANEYGEMSVMYKETLGASIVANQLPELISNLALNKWVEDGVHLHKDHQTKCMFCGERIPPARLKELELHFSDEYQKTMNALDGAFISLKNFKDKMRINFPEIGVFYEELQGEAIVSKKKLEIIKEKIIEAIDDVEKQLLLKKSNPFNVVNLDDAYVEVLLGELLEERKNLDVIAKKHNDKNADFNKSVLEANYLLELHFVSEQLQDGTLKLKKEQLLGLEIDEKIFDTKKKTLSGEVQKIESLLVNVVIAADSFNKDLEQFLGRGDIKLDFKKEIGGYQLTRNGKKEIASNLSEGEKTAVVFVYFITKLKEVGANLANKIIVLDDPISSFDSSNMSNTFSFIRHHLDGCLQLFVLTHNFEFFKLVRDWMKNKNRPDKNGVVKEKSKFYFVQSIAGESRTSEIVPLSKELLNYESEYHFFFFKVYVLKDKAVLPFEEAHFVGNSCRKILEAFLAFKYPAYKDDFAGLLNRACSHNMTLSYKIYTFVNKYSHLRSLEVMSGGSDNMHAESQNIIKDVFELIKSIDDNHFVEMEKICK